MGNVANDQAVWTLRESVAELNCKKIAGRINVSRPDQGLHKLAIDGAKHGADLLRVYRAGSPDKSWPLPVAESYIRAQDLVASYQVTDIWPFSPQLYWRANSLN